MTCYRAIDDGGEGSGYQFVDLLKHPGRTRRTEQRKALWRNRRGRRLRRFA
jgi:hypothetical protein